MSFIRALSKGDWLNLRRVRAYPRIFLVVFLLIGTLWAGGLHARFHPDEGALVTDFINVYTAGVTVHEGKPELAYDWSEQKNREDKITQSLSGEKPIVDGGYIPWLYPPMFLGVAWLVAFLPYFVALGVYSIAGLVAYGVTLRRLAPLQYAETKWVLVAFPGVFVNLFSGQNGFITAALVAAGLFLLDEAPVAAGVAFGALSYKPHFFVLIPLVLLVGRYWKALAATLLSAGVCAGLSFAAFGVNAWLAFFHGLAATRTNILEIGTDRWLGILHSVFSMVRVLGGGLQAAYLLQTFVAGCAVLVLVWIWSRRGASLAVRGGVLCGALLLASPYSFVYDQVLLAIPIALLVREGLQRGFLSFEKTFLFALWLLPFFVQDSGAHFALPLTPPMLVGLIFLCWRRARVTNF